ncbi:hypothetical protein CQW23_35003 [Capsicum baccatum]|uniref:Uncharacterized protein n=1 Tax=Capsicum baccatum TaxID=33114 RepID=A0A2G2UX96_CAPBA|nr:hypothetical protein CQW23_35003 [Capsicum baccatum]
MAGGLEEPFRLSFQAKLLLDLTLYYCHFQMHFYVNWDVEPLSTSSCVTSNLAFDLWQSGSISFGRFENEALRWERRSSFTHNRATTLLENEKYQASENEGYAGRFEHVNEVGHFARFDENYDSSTHLSKNGKYQAENTGYDRDSERVNEVSDLAHFEESFDGSNNGDIKVTECGGEGSSNGDIKVTECGREDSISCHSGPQIEQDSNSSDVLQSVPECLEAEAKLNLVLEIQLLMIQSFVSSGSKANVLNQHKSTEEQPIARKVVASRASCTEKVSHRLYQSVNRKRNADCSFDLHCAMYRKRKKQRSNSYGEISISKQLLCPHSIVNLSTAKKKPRFLWVQKLMYLINIKVLYEARGESAYQKGRNTLAPSEKTCNKPKELASKTKSQSRPSTAAGARATSATDNTVRCLRAEVYNRCSTNEHLNVADSPQVSEVTIHPLAELSDSSVPSVATSKTSKQTQSNRTVAPKREQEKR